MNKILRPLLLLCFFCACSENNYPTEEQSENFCLIIENAINNGSSEFLNRIFDAAPLVDYVTSNYNAPEYYSEGFKNGFQQAYSLGDVMISSKGFEGYSKFLKLKEYSQDTIIALYRTISEAGINYQELYLKADSEGELHIVDLYSYAEGDFFSRSIERLYLINLAAELDTFNHPIADNLPVINEIAALADGGEYALALQKLEALPPIVKKEKIVQIIRMNLANEISQGTLNSVVEDFKEKFPKDNLVYLKLMELAFLNEDNNFTISCIDSLDNKIGGDPYLKILKAGVYRKNAQDELAEKMLKEAITEEPDNDDAYWPLIDILILQKRYTETIEVFADVRNIFEENAAEYVVYDGYDDFYQSSEFKVWLKENPIDTSTTIINNDYEKYLEEALEHHDHDHDHHGHHH